MFKFYCNLFNRHFYRWSCSSLFAPKPYKKACYAGYSLCFILTEVENSKNIVGKVVVSTGKLDFLMLYFLLLEMICSWRSPTPIMAHLVNYCWWARFTGTRETRDEWKLARETHADFQWEIQIRISWISFLSFNWEIRKRICKTIPEKSGLRFANYASACKTIVLN